MLLCFLSGFVRVLWDCWIQCFTQNVIQGKDIRKMFFLISVFPGWQNSLRPNLGFAELKIDKESWEKKNDELREVKALK